MLSYRLGLITLCPSHSDPDPLVVSKLINDLVKMLIKDLMQMLVKYLMQILTRSSIRP